MRVAAAGEAPPRQRTQRPSGPHARSCRSQRKRLHCETKSSGLPPPQRRDSRTVLPIAPMQAVESFLSELDAQNRVALERIGVAAVARARGRRDRREAAPCSRSRTRSRRPSARPAGFRRRARSDVKLALARQAGDEAKHFRLIERRLGELGVDASAFDPAPRSPMLEYLLSLTTTVERVAAGQFTREALALVRNDEFIRFCESARRSGHGGALPRRHPARRTPPPRARARPPRALASSDDAREARARRRPPDAGARRGAAGDCADEARDLARTRVLTRSAPTATPPGQTQAGAVQTRSSVLRRRAVRGWPRIAPSRDQCVSRKFTSHVIAGRIVPLLVMSPVFVSQVAPSM